VAKGEFATKVVGGAIPPAIGCAARVGAAPVAIGWVGIAIAGPTKGVEIGAEFGYRPEFTGANAVCPRII
jgi:hypothetical protein